MTVLALGLNHGSAPLDLRGRLAFAPDTLGRSVQALRQQWPTGAPEVAILSTCNRTELYLGLPAGAGNAPARHAPGRCADEAAGASVDSAAGPASQAASEAASDAAAHLAEPALAWLARHGRCTPADLRRHCYCHEGAAAARHVFRVAAGLDSMVLGEPQILGQMKTAVRAADTAGVLGATLHQMFQRSFAVAKDVRSRTDIGAHAVSLAAAAVRLAQQLFDDLSRRRVLLVGAGEMIERVATHMAAQKPLQMAVANRHAERGRLLAQRLGAQTLPLADLAQALPAWDVVVSCTASTQPLIGLAAVERAVKARKRQPMLMVDLAVPRDIDPAVARLDDVYLYTVDDLAHLVQVNGQRRQAAVAQAEAIVGAGVDSFVQWLDQRASVPLIQALHRQTEDWRQAELGKARRALARGQDVDAVMDTLSAALTRKLLHGALSELHGSAGDTHRQWVRSVQRLFLRDGT